MNIVNTGARAQVFKELRNSLNNFSAADISAIEKKFSSVQQSEAPKPTVDDILVDRFIDKLCAVHGTVKRVPSYSKVPDAVGQYLQEHGLESDMVMGGSEFLRQFDWPIEWDIKFRTAVKTDIVSVSDAICIVAETGTILMASSPDTSSTHAFLPENHIVIVNSGQVVRHLDDALRLAESNIKDTSRGVHLITGPSKTADVEQTIQYGAHGPRRLHAIIIDPSYES